MNKKCTKCGEVKSLSEFSKQKASKDGLQYYCKTCSSNQITAKRRTLEGKLKSIYRSMRSHQKRRTKNNGTLQLVDFAKREFVEVSIVHPEYIRLHGNWVESGYKKELAPSFDRKDDYGDYSWSNFNRWITWQENKDKGHEDQSNGNNVKRAKAVRGVHIKTGNIVEFFSQQEASRQLGIDTGNICSCCLGKRNSAGGYIWSFSDMNGDKQNDRTIDL